MKVIFLQDDFPPYAKGGAGIVAATLARELAKRGHELTVVTSVQDKALAGSFQEDGMRIERIYSDYAPRWRSWISLYNPATVGRVKEILAEIKPDVVHAHNVHYHLSYWSLRRAKKCGAKVFLTAHDVMLFHYGKLTEHAPKDCTSPRNYRVNAWQQLRRFRFWYNPVRNVAIRHLIKNVSRIFAVSGALKEALEQNGIRNVGVIHNGIDIDEWDVSPETIDAFQHNQNLNGKKPILFGGRISSAKGGTIMLAAMREIVNKEPLSVLLLLGTPDAYMKKLLARAEEWGIAKQVRAVGWLSGDALRAAYHSAAVIAVPSICFDSFPTVILEAMACRRSVVSACFGGAPEMVQQGVTGYLVPPNNERALEQVLADEAFRTAAGARARSKVEKKFSHAMWREDTLRAYTREYS